MVSTDYLQIKLLLSWFNETDLLEKHPSSLIDMHMNLGACIEAATSNISWTFYIIIIFKSHWGEGGLMGESKWQAFKMVF